MIAADTPITFNGDRMRVGFDYRSPAAYELFLRVKRLPEYEIELDPVGLAAAVTAPARFAGMLGLERPRSLGDELPLSGFLFDDQAAILRMALDAKRFAVWSDCGLGKTPIGLEFGRQVVAMTGGRVLIVTLNEIVPQWFTEAEKFYGPGGLPILRLESREELKQWCATGKIARHAEDTHGGSGDQNLRADGQRSVHGGNSSPERPCDVGRLVSDRDGGRGASTSGARDGAIAEDEPRHSASGEDSNDGRGIRSPHDVAQIAVVNYEKFNHRGDLDQVVSEIKLLAGIILDESSRLKTGGGKQKWALIKSAKGVEYKLSLTATPAPNEIMEFASQASFLEKMRSDNEIIWTYFRRDEKTHRWTVKPHARKAFFEFMAGWSIYVRDPRKYGWRLGVERPPEPIMYRHELKMSQQQRDLVLAINADGANVSEANRGSMFVGELNAIAANKLSQAAKGFRYISHKQGDSDASTDLHGGTTGGGTASTSVDAVSKARRDGDGELAAAGRGVHEPRRDSAGDRDRERAGSDGGVAGENVAGFEDTHAAVDGDGVDRFLDTFPDAEPELAELIALDPISGDSDDIDDTRSDSISQQHSLSDLPECEKTRADNVRPGLWKTPGGNQEAALQPNRRGLRVGDRGGDAQSRRTSVPPAARPVRRTVAVIDSVKPRFTADLIAAEATAVDAGGLGLQTLVWTVYDEESAILGRLLKGSPFTFEILNGKTSTAERAAILERFRSGQTRVLISLAGMLGYGMNFQFVGSMVFSGWTFSYESFYQAVRRAYRHGQTRAVRVHLPVIPELEGQMYDAIVRKQAQHEQAIAEMESNYVAAREAVTGAKEAA